uniref:Uncharacterized protein n=1 Tax=Globisporangium ultimum (strain ATCC 200006 / CBS 805.95 / DAOM BR144) TaxID=431595 RepID=K3WG44_GLOUD
MGAAAVSIVSPQPQQDASALVNGRDEDAMQDLCDRHMLELLEQELAQVQRLKNDAQLGIERLLDEQKRLEFLERREKAQEAKNASQHSRMDRIQQLQEQERLRRQALVEEQQRAEKERRAQIEEARRKQAHSIQTHEDQDLDNLDDFLAQESSYF